MESCEGPGLMPPARQANPATRHAQPRIYQVRVVRGIPPGPTAHGIWRTGCHSYMRTRMPCHDGSIYLYVYIDGYVQYKLVQAKSQDVGLSLLPDWLSHESRLGVQRCSNASISLAPAAVYPPSLTSRRRRAQQVSTIALSFYL